MKRFLSWTLVLLLVVSSSQSFAAVSQTDAAKYLKEIGAIKGDQNGDLHENEYLTRAEAVTTIARLVGMESTAQAIKTPAPFSDVDADGWSNGYIALAEKEKWTNGIGEGKFGPNRNVTIKQYAAFMLRVLGQNVKYDETMPKAKELGILDGVSNSNPEDQILRGDVFIMMYHTHKQRTTSGHTLMVGLDNIDYNKIVGKLVKGSGLMSFTKDGQFVESILVQSKTVSEDALTWTFKLKDDLTFHNGEALTASDVKFTYDYYMNLDALSANGLDTTLAQHVDRVTIHEEDNSVTVVFKQVSLNNGNDLMVSILPESLITEGASREGVSEHKFLLNHVSEPIGCGPYRLTEYVQDQYVKLTAFDKYAGSAPMIKDVQIKAVLPEDGLEQVDLLPYQYSVDLINNVKAKYNPAYDSYYRNGSGVLILHTDFGPTKLTEVRQAFAYAFNRPKVIELFLGQQGVAPRSVYNKNQRMLYDNDEMYKIETGENSRFEDSLINYDILDNKGNFDEGANIAKAHELLDAAAKRTDGDYAKLTGSAQSGYLWDNQPMVIDVACTEFWSDTYNLVWNQTYLSRLGFDVRLSGLEWPTLYGHWIGDTEADRQYNIFVGGQIQDAIDNPINYHATDLIKSWGKPSDNSSRFSGGSSYTPEAWNALLSEIDQTSLMELDTTYKTLWRDYIKVINKEVPVIPVYQMNYNDLYNKHLKNYDVNGKWSWEDALPLAYWEE